MERSMLNSPPQVLDLCAQWAGKVMATSKMQRVPSGSLLTRMSQAASEPVSMLPDVQS